MMDVAKIGYTEEEKRWKAEVTYRVTSTETLSVTHHFEELYELQQIIEDGPTFCAISDFNITYCGLNETIEDSYQIIQAIEWERTNENI